MAPLLLWRHVVRAPFILVCAQHNGEGEREEEAEGKGNLLNRFVIDSPLHIPLGKFTEFHREVIHPFQSFRAPRCGRICDVASLWGTRAWCCSGWGGTRAGRTTASPPTRRAAPTPTPSSSTYDVSECPLRMCSREKRFRARRSGGRSEASFAKLGRTAK